MKKMAWLLAAGLATWLGATPAMAQSTWNFGSGVGSCDPTGSPGQVLACGGTNTSTTVQGTGWSNTGAGGAFVQASLQDFDPYGLGLVSGSREYSANNHHAFDNGTTNCGTGGTSGAGTTQRCGGTIELMTLNFTEKVNLTSVTVAGFLDTDVALYRWDGSNAGPNMTTTTAALGNSSLAGWSLVKSEDVGGSNNSGGGTFFSTSANTDASVSSWWLITTYFGSGMDTLTDSFKITSVTGNVCAYSGSSSNGGACTPGTPPPSNGVPEPSTWLLVGLAMAGLWWSRRQGRGINWRLALPGPMIGAAA
jgi:hypothetical protein